MNPILKDVPPATRRALLVAEKRARSRGRWGQWETIAFPDGAPIAGWGRDVSHAVRNAVFCVLVRPLAAHGVVHLAVSSLSGERPSWHEMQRIKDEIAGPERTAVEIYPPRGDIVDGADMFHLWVLEAPLPFGLHVPATEAAA